MLYVKRNFCLQHSGNRSLVVILTNVTEYLRCDQYTTCPRATLRPTGWSHVPLPPIGFVTSDTRSSVIRRSEGSVGSSNRVRGIYCQAKVSYYDYPCYYYFQSTMSSYPLIFDLFIMCTPYTWSSNLTPLSTRELVIQWQIIPTTRY